MRSLTLAEFFTVLRTRMYTHAYIALPPVLHRLRALPDMSVLER